MDMVVNKTKYNKRTFAGLKDMTKSVFATGGDMKSQFSFFHRGQMYLSNDYGDLSYADNYGRYIDAVKQMKEECVRAPDIVAYDLHPGYFSSHCIALFPQAKHIGIQHHHAHIAGLLAATDTKDPIIGVSFDGTGYGSDGHVWGGEFLVVSPLQWSRDGHLRYMKMPGGEMAVREPWRMAFSILYEAFGDTIF